MATETTTTTVMQQMADILDRLTNQPQGLTPEQLAAIVTTASTQAAEVSAEGMRRVMHPQNAQHPGISAYSHPEGDVKRPKATLTRTVFFCGHREDPSQLTPNQIDLYNRFDRTMTARDGSWTAEIKGKDLHVMVPCKTIDDRMNLPSLDLILRELLDGQASVDPLSLADRVLQLEAELRKVHAA